MTSLLLLAFLKFPLLLNPQNTQVHFSVDSTWHLIEGEAEQIRGEIVLLHPPDLSSAQVEVHLPVKDFNTKNSRRDERMWEVMQAEAFPEVIFRAGSLRAGCEIERLTDGIECEASLPGEIQIRDVKRPLSLSVTVRRDGETLSFQGKSSLNWDEFGVEDPSILIAKLDRVVNIVVDVKLPIEP